MTGGDKQLGLAQHPVCGRGSCVEIDESTNRAKHLN